MSPVAVAAVGERESDAVGILIEALDARAEAVALLAETAEQDIEQVGAVRGVVRRTETRLGPLAERRVVEPVAGVPGAIVAPFRIVGDARQRIAEAERPQDARCIAADLEAGADLRERRRLLEQLGLDAALPQRQQRRDAADAAARDQDLEIFLGHEAALLETLLRLSMIPRVEPEGMLFRKPVPTFRDHALEPRNIRERHPPRMHMHAAELGAAMQRREHLAGVEQALRRRRRI